MAFKINNCELENGNQYNNNHNLKQRLEQQEQ